MPNPFQPSKNYPANHQHIIPKAMKPSEPIPKPSTPIPKPSRNHPVALKIYVFIERERETESERERETAIARE